MFDHIANPTHGADELDPENIVDFGAQITDVDVNNICLTGVNY